jgi:hypothetical protein
MGIRAWEDGEMSEKACGKRAGEIKSLDHWRMLEKAALRMLEKATVPASSTAAVYITDDQYFEMRRASCSQSPPVPARAPFPARALRDRPWDISALVE